MRGRQRKESIEFLKNDSGSTGESDLSFFQPDEGKERGIISRRVLVVCALILAGVYLFSLLFIVQYNPLHFSLAYVRTIIQQNITDVMDAALGRGVHHAVTMKMQQYVMIVLVGAALSGAGAMFKTIFRNILAAPTTMGVQEGGILGNFTFLWIFGGTVMVETTSMSAGKIHHAAEFFLAHGQSISIFVGCFLGCIIVMLIATTAGGGQLSTSALILAGTMVNGVIVGITGTIQYYLSRSSGDDDLIQLLMNMTLGSFDFLFRSETLRVMLVTLLPCFVLVFALSGQMNLYALGEEEATAMGVHVRKLKIVIILIGTFMTSITMIYCGHIAFVGFIVPQLIWKTTGSDFRVLFPASLLLGGAFTLAVYDVALIFGTTDALSLITTAIGTVMMLVVLMRKRGQRNAAVA